MKGRRLIAQCGAVLCFTTLAACQSDSESDTAEGTSTAVVLEAATQTGTVPIGDVEAALPPLGRIQELPTITGTEVPMPPVPPVSVTDISVDDHDGVTRITYRFDGNGKAFWKTEYVSEAIRAGDSTVVDVAGQSILQVDLMGVDGASVSAPSIPESESITRMESAATGSTVLQSFVGTADIRPAYTVSSAGSPPRLMIDIHATEG